MSEPSDVVEVDDDDWVSAFVLLANGLTHLVPDELPQLVTRCAELLGASEPLILLADMEQQLLRPFPPGQDPFQVDAPGAGVAFRTEEVVVEPGQAGLPDRLWIPLMDSAERLGVLGVDVPATGQVQRWTAFASLIGEALVSKTAYGDAIVLARRSHPMALAAELRWSILPPLTFTSPRVDISGILEPAYDIAGDTFDYSVSADRVDLAILDAMGHGLEASQIANLAVGEYRRMRRLGADLGSILRSIDDVIVSEVGDSRFVTGQLATFEFDSGALIVVNAGHPRPLLFRGAGLVGELECTPCPPMGLGLVSTEEARHKMQPGDTVLFHTDGITEARSPAGVEFGATGIGDAVARGLVRDDRPAEILRQLIRDVVIYTDGRLRDDASAVLLRRP